MVEITRIFWRNAYTSDGLLFGEVHSAELDTSNWKIINLFVSLSEEASSKLGFKHPFLGKVIVCLPVSTVESISDKITLNKSIEELKNIKQCRE